MREGGRLNSIQVLRGAAALVVLLYHVALVEGTRLTPPPSYPLLSWVPSFGYGGVNLFFVISGFIMYWITVGKWGDPNYWRTFIGKRIRRIYPVLFVCFALDLAVNLYLGNAVRCVFGAEPYAVVSMLLLLPGEGSPLCLLPQAWTLCWEVYFYAVFSLVFLLRPLEAKNLAIAWLAISVVLTIGGEEWAGKRAPQWGVYNLHFALGIAAAWLATRSTRGALVAVVLGIAWVGVSAWANSVGVGETGNIRHRLVQFGVGSFLLVYGLSALEQRGQIFSRWLVSLGDVSYSLYLTHLFVLALIRAATAGLDHSFVPHAVWLALMIGIPLLFAYAFHMVVERPLVNGAWAAFPRRVPASS